MFFYIFGSVTSKRAKVFLRNNISTQNSALKSGTYIHSLRLYKYRVAPPGYIPERPGTLCKLSWAVRVKFTQASLPNVRLSSNFT